MEKHPVIDYQSGSLRDDFDFGSLWCIKAQALADYIAQPDREEYQFAALYDLRLYLSRVGEISISTNSSIQKPNSTPVRAARSSLTM